MQLPDSGYTCSTNSTYPEQSNYWQVFQNGPKKVFQAQNNKTNKSACLEWGGERIVTTV